MQILLFQKFQRTVEIVFPPESPLCHHCPHGYSLPAARVLAGHEGSFTQPRVLAHHSARTILLKTLHLQSEITESFSMLGCYSATQLHENFQTGHFSPYIGTIFN